MGKTKNPIMRKKLHSIIIIDTIILKLNCMRKSVDVN